MADSKHKPPTRAEAADAIRGICGTYTKETLGMLESAGVVFAPEPVAEPSDPLGVIVKDRTGKLWCWDDRDGIWKCANSFIDLDWSRIPQPVTLFRVVYTPEPAPLAQWEKDIIADGVDTREFNSPPAPAGTITIPRPVVDGRKADADYLREASVRIEHGFSVGGIDLTATVVKLLRDCAESSK